MSDTPNTSKMHVYMVRVKADLELNVVDIGEVVIGGTRSTDSVIAKAVGQNQGQIVSIRPATGTNATSDSKGPSITYRFIVTVFDHSQLRRECQRHGQEIMEDIMRQMHGKSYLRRQACDETLITGMNLAFEGAPIYEIAVSATVDLTTTEVYPPIETT